MKNGKLPTLALCLASTLASAQTYDQIWEQYCSSDKSVKRKSADLPKVNYDNPLIKEVSSKLNEVHPNSFYLYSDIEKVYGLCTKKQASECSSKYKIPEGINVKTHNFLTIICGEFRDNIKMLEGKLNWVKKLSIVKDGEQAYDPKKEVFEQLTGQGYLNLIEFSENLYAARESVVPNHSSHLTLEQNSVEAATICEYRYILSEYLSQGKEFYDTTLSEYEAGLKKFEKSCSAHDKKYYYEFRGDGNFKPQSLESNAFIWNSRLFSKNCTSTTKSKRGTVLNDIDCQNYFKSPFKTRENLTKQGMMRLFYYPEKYHSLMKDYKGSLVFITEDIDNDKIAEMVVIDYSSQGENYNAAEQGADLVEELREGISEQREYGNYYMSKVYSKLIHHIVLKNAIAKLASQGDKNKRLESTLRKSTDYLEYTVKRLKKDLEKNPEDTDTQDEIERIEEVLITNTFKGVEIVFEKYSDEVNKKSKINQIFKDKNKAWDRIATVLDRHTDWYQIDMLNLKLGEYIPTYSPWVASSYYINKSDDFTIPGYAMGLPGDGHRHWMFVQKVLKKNWFKASDLRESTDWENANLDIFNTWFDETTFSRSSLGAHEQGWDRFGSASYKELGAIIYLYHSEELETGGGFDW